jgi:hypothetical protein
MEQALAIVLEILFLLLALGSLLVYDATVALPPHLDQFAVLDENWHGALSA